MLVAMFLCLVAAFNPELAFAERESKVWDGSVDVSWYNSAGTVFYINTPAQLAGLAALVNGHVDVGVTPDMITGAFNQSADFLLGIDDFNGKTVYLNADLDMGGVWDSTTGIWEGPNYTPIGGQWCIDVDDAATCLNTSFNGTLDGQGHTVKNICCHRYTPTGYGYSQGVGLVGRLGCHDQDDKSMWADNPAVRNVAVTGHIYARRSVGGIVGKIGKTNKGGIIENCANLATVSNTDAKGCGGIVGAGWNGGLIKNCYNAGHVYSTYACPTGGISGSNEVDIYNCYNVGSIAGANPDYAQGIGVNNGGSQRVSNCYWVTGSASGGYYNGGSEVNVTAVTPECMQSAEFLVLLNGEGRAFVADTANRNGGYPVLRRQTEDTSLLTDIVKVSDPARTCYVAGQNFDDTGLEIWARYSDGTGERITGYTISKVAALGTTDGVVTISGIYGGRAYSFEFPIRVDADGLLTELHLGGSPHLCHAGAPLKYDLDGLSLTGWDQGGGPFSVNEQAVGWTVVSGPATVSGSVLTITGSGLVEVRATVNDVNSNILCLNVNAVSNVLPQGIVLSWTDDTETTQTVSWYTADAAQQMVQYLPADNYRGDFDGAWTLEAVASYLYTSNGNDWYHEEAAISGLSPQTSYVYRVGREGAWSEPASFTTAGSGDQFSFLYMGDVQEGFASWGQLLDAAGAEDAGPKFALLGGDLVDYGNSSNQWEQFFAAASPLFREIPLMPVAGNHDNVAGTLFWSHFALPQNGPAGYEERVYSFDYNNCHIVGLDSDLMTEPGTDSFAAISTWLAEDLEGSDKTWKVVFFHYPPYPVAFDKHTANLQANWVPLLEQGGVDVVFVGHQHVYMRTKPVKAGQIAPDRDGIVYLMGNAGTKHYPPGDDLDYIACQIPNVSNYELVNIEGDTFTLAAKDACGQIIDSYVMGKQVTVPVTGVSLDKDINELVVGDTFRLTADITPIGATNRNVTWTSSNEAVATVDNRGKLTALGAGEAIITVTTNDGSFSASCTVTVSLTPVGQYTVALVKDTAVYSPGETSDGIKTMTINSGVSAMKYFSVQAMPEIEHDGLETVVFTHLRGGAQVSLNAAKADLDSVDVDVVRAGFNVLSGDVVKVYIVDELTNAADSNPTVLQ